MCPNEKLLLLLYFSETNVTFLAQTWCSIISSTNLENPLGRTLETKHNKFQVQISVKATY